MTIVIISSIIISMEKIMKKAGRPEGTKKNGLKYLNNEQLKAFITAVEKGKNRRNELLMKLTLFLGLRVGELARIKTADVEEDSRAITVQGLKGGRKRTYSELPPKLWRMLQRWMRENPGEQVFSLTEQAIKNVFKKVAKEAGLNGSFSIHTLRHTVGIMKARQGDSPIKIMLWLRHRKIDSTQVYFEQVEFENESVDMNKMFGDIL